MVECTGRFMFCTCTRSGSPHNGIIRLVMVECTGRFKGGLEDNHCSGSKS